MRKKSRNVIDLLEKMIEARFPENENLRLLEKTPQHVFHIGFIIKRFPKSKIINIVRDPRDCFLSSKSNDRVKQASAKKYAVYWNRSIKNRIKYFSNDRILDIRYEDFVSDPENQLQKIMAWLELSIDPKQLNVSLMSKDLRANSPNFRLLGGPISTESVGRWKTMLSEVEAETIERKKIL